MAKTKTPPKVGEDPFLAKVTAMAREKGLDLEPDPDDTTGRTETKAEKAARLAVVAANVKARWENRLPVMYAGATLDDVAADDLPTEPLTWLAKDSSPTLILAGPVGTGKTHTAYAIGNTAVARGVWTEAWTVTRLLEALRPGGEPQAADDVRRCALLILDDLGAQKASDWAVDTLTELVDDRLKNGRRQIITTNHPYASLEAAWGARLLDRLRFRWTIATLSGESRRMAETW